MVFHEIENLGDVISGHRVIMYYIQDVAESKLKLRNSVENVMDMLGKKNDDLIIFKVNQHTHQFTQFKELYKPEINSPIALFLINREGIPLICEQIFKDDDISQAFDSVCTCCKLNSVSKSEITKAILSEPEILVDETNLDIVTNGLKYRLPQQPSNISQESHPPLVDSRNFSSDSQEVVQPTSTELQIRLPDGTKEKQKFDRHALLQEVFDFIRTKFNLSDFDLKTYNRNVFTAEDYVKTLQELDLTPNGVVIVVYKSVVPFNRHGNNLSNMINYGFWILFGKVTPIFKYFQSLFYALWNSVFSSGNQSSTSTQNQSEGRSASTNNGKNTSNGFKKSSSRFGNIHTLRRGDDSDDENNRYNGNSTQQK